jgi:hypothetical protein
MLCVNVPSMSNMTNRMEVAPRELSDRCRRRPATATVTSKFSRSDRLPNGALQRPGQFIVHLLSPIQRAIEGCQREKLLDDLWTIVAIGHHDKS